jgi:arabinofuranosyltransferase
MTTPTTHTTRVLPRPVAALLLLVFLAVLLRTAWISDDGLISLRTVMNVTHGNGLTFNIGERVQTFTHPLWLALLTAGYLAIGNVYYVTFALSIVVSV